MGAWCDYRRQPARYAARSKPGGVLGHRPVRIAAATLAIIVSAAACGSAATSASGVAPSHHHHHAVKHSPKIGYRVYANGSFGNGCPKLPATGAGSSTAMASEPVATAAAHNPLLAGFSLAVRAADIADQLNSARAITVFAPDNGAFTSLGSGNVQTLLTTKSDIRRLLEYHVVRGRITPAQLATGAALKTELGLPVYPGQTTRGIFEINNSDVVCGNLQTENATVYIINSVLVP
jgi:uncharacterized surface protein with fasciclin (FAS1) repeats